MIVSFVIHSREVLLHNYDLVQVDDKMSLIRAIFDILSGSTLINSGATAWKAPIKITNMNSLFFGKGREEEKKNLKTSTSTGTTSVEVFEVPNLSREEF